MSQEQRKEEIMNEMEALDTPLHTIKDRMTNLGKYRKYALEQTFGKEPELKRGIKNMINFYDTLNKSFGLELDDEQQALVKACKSLDREMLMVQKEVAEREDFYQMLKKYFESENVTPLPLLKEALFHFEGMTRLFDEIIVTPEGIITVDIKHPKRHVSIDSDGHYIEFDYRDARIERYSILEMQKQGKAILQGVLKRCGYEEIQIHPIVVFMGEIDYANLCDQVTTMNMSQFEKYLDELIQESKLDDKRQRKILECLSEVSDQSEPIEYHFVTAFIEAYADIRSKIEARLGKLS